MRIIKLSKKLVIHVENENSAAHADEAGEAVPGWFFA